MIRPLAALALSIALVVPATAWDDQGHTVIGIIAYQELSEGQRAKLVKILNAGEPEFKIIPDQEAFTVGKTATWADFIKRNPSAFDKEIDAFNDWAYPPSQRGQDNNEGTRCRCWHYKNIVVHAEGRQNRVKHAPFDAVKAIELAKTKFSESTTDRMKAFWIYWIGHVVGDLHQPLHCVSSVKFNPAGDAGGNGFALSGEVRNLHWLWDNGIKDGVSVDGWRGGLVEKATEIRRRHPASSFAEIKELDPQKWCEEGAKLSVSTAYEGIEPNTAPSPDYEKRRKETSLKQAALGGYRLAGVFRGLLGD